MRTPLILLATVVLAGCGTTDKQATPASTQTPTAATATTTATPEPIGGKLSALCARYNPTAEKLNDRVTQQLEVGDLQAAAAGYGEMLDKAAEFDAEVEALDPPAGEVRALRRYQGANRRIRELVRDFIGDLEAGDTSTAAAISARADRLQQARLDAALELGADDCGG